MNMVKQFRWKMWVQGNIILVGLHAHLTVKRSTALFSSKSKGITAEILVNILKYFDSKEIFP